MTGSPRPVWKTASARATSNGPGSDSSDGPGSDRPHADRRVLMGELLSLATAGSVDDGKSTLIGRLLFDSKAVFEDQLEAVERVSRQRGEEYTDLALLT